MTAGSLAGSPEAIGPAPASRFQQAIETTRNRRPRSALLAGFGSAWVETGRVAAAPSVRWRTVGVITLLILALAAGAVFVGNQPRRLPAVVGPTGNGLIAYSSNGDIYVGDRVTGRATAIVTGTAVDSSPKFSPDGSRIAFMRGDPWGADASIIVVRADGSDERVVMPARLVPDGSKIAYQRGCPHPDRQGAVVVIADVASGAERVLESTAVETKYEGDVSPLPPGKAGGCFGGWIQDTEGRAWDYEGWSWSPDGRSVVLLERHGTRPTVVDVESGQATELPWGAASPPSWQRILPN